MNGTPFAVNVLAEGQLDLALHFAGRSRPDFKVPWVDHAAVPRLLGVVAWLECQSWKSYDGGDHVLHIGEVTHYDARRTKPLLFHCGDFRMMGLSLYELPRIVPLDGRPIADWVGHAHRFHEITDVSPEEGP